MIESVRGNLHGAYDKEFRPALNSFLRQFDWDYFFTFTTAYHLSVPAARRLMVRYMDSLNSMPVFGETPHCFFVLERHKDRPSVHIHGLLQAPCLSANTCWEQYQRISGGRKLVKDASGDLKPAAYNRAEVKKYLDTGGAEAYVTKYLTKELLDWDFLWNASDSFANPEWFSRKAK